METFDRLTDIESRLSARYWKLGCYAAIGLSILLAVLMHFFPPNRPVDYESEQDHFYYGSIGSDITGGLPLKVVRVLPAMFPEYLPPGASRQDYTAFGFIQQPGHAMPIGFSTRRRLIDFTAINCAVCHTGSVRETADSEPQVIASMPANTVNLLAFFQFLFACAGDDRFNATEILAAMKAADIDAPLDGLIYRLVVPRLKEALLEREQKLAFIADPDYPAFGPGRVNTFDTFKFDQFAPYYQRHGQAIADDEIFGIVDFTSVWNQNTREGMDLHWDGNNSSVRERNFSAAVGAGATPPDMDIPRLFRVEAWLNDLPPPDYPFAIDREAAERGAKIYQQYCFECHDVGGGQVGKVVAIDEIGTDRGRLDSYTDFLRRAQRDYTKGYFWEFKNFKKTNGYANQPLDGIWARAPYLHNGSVPNLWALLTAEDQRPVAFTIGHDVYDQANLGFQHESLKPGPDGTFITASGDQYAGNAFVLDTRLRGNRNRGHTGRAYGTELSDDEKRALIEYFKWQDRP